MLRYVVIAAGVGVLAYLGVRVMQDDSGAAMPILLVLAGLGALLAKDRRGPALCLGGFALSIVWAAIPLIARPEGAQLALQLGAIVVALAGAGAAWSLMRRARAEGPDPA